MVAVDSNVLIYAHRRESREHSVAQRVLTELAEGGVPWAIPWPCIFEFFSIVTNARIWKSRASSAEEAWRQIRAWCESPTNRLIGETEDFLFVLDGFLSRPRVRGSVVHDARIAALCVAHGIEALLTRDRDFALFPELRVDNPFD